MKTFTAWVGRENSISFILQSGSPLIKLPPEQMAAILNYGFTFKGKEYSSLTHASICSKDDTQSSITFKVGRIQWDALGKPSALAGPGYDDRCELIIYTIVNPKGLIWGPQFKLIMKQDN